jgi:hypothetical protein
MSTQRNNNGGHAFPTLFIDPEHGSGYAGMTLRDWFAGMALQGMIANVNTSPKTSSLGRQFIAKNAFQLADAMIEARKKDYIIDRGEDK